MGAGMTWLLAVLLAAADPATAYKDLKGSQADDARARVATVVRALEDAGMPRSATVFLAALGSDPQQSAGVREAARDALAARSASDPALGQFLLAEQADPGKLPAPLAVALARGHLERALQLAPPAEGAAFSPIEEGPGVKAAASVQPLDKELAAEMGQAAQEPQKQPPPRSAKEEEAPKQARLELDRARALAASVPAGDPAAGDAHEVAGLAALAAGDDGGAAQEFLALARLPVKKGDDAALERRDKAYLQLARLAYQAGDDRRATQLYDSVGRGAPEWLDALFEASWAHFRRGEDEKALGNLLTLHAPFFQGRFFPESFVLKALVFYGNCRYADARAALTDFVQRYQALHDGMAEALVKLGSPEAAAEVLSRGPVALQETVPASAREEVARLSQEQDIEAAVAAARQLAQEIDSIDRRPEPFRRSALIAVVAPKARKARLALLEASGRKLVSRLSRERAELRELLGQSLRLSFEIAGREKELATSPDPNLAATQRKERLEVEDDEELWPFQGEYWRDELGSYRYQLGTRCRKPRAQIQTAAQPSSPEKVAADPR